MPKQRYFALDTKLGQKIRKKLPKTINMRKLQNQILPSIGDALEQTNHYSKF